MMTQKLRKIKSINLTYDEDNDIIDITYVFDNNPTEEMVKAGSPIYQMIDSMNHAIRESYIKYFNKTQNKNRVSPEMDKEIKFR